MNHKLFILLLCTIGLSAGAMEMSSSGKEKVNISDQKELFHKLYLAIRDDRLEDVQELVPAQINIDGLYLDWTPLITAVINERPAIIRYLIKSGADLYCESMTGCIALHYLPAMSEDGLACADLIFEAMLDLSPSQKDQICSIAFCTRNATENTALPECELPVVERLCQEFYAENREKVIKKTNFIMVHRMREYLLEKYCPELQEAKE